MLMSKTLDLAVIDFPRRFVETISNHLEQFAGKIDRGAVCEVTAMIQVHTHQGVTGFHKCQIGSGIGL